MQLTIDLPNYLAASVNANRENLDRIFEAGLLDQRARSSAGYKGLMDVLRFLVSLPSPDEILALRPSKELSIKISEVAERSKNNEMTPADEKFWESYELIEHLVRQAKKAALRKIEQ
jgi:hypothetical protein